jgi:hypothetical protein
MAFYHILYDLRKNAATLHSIDDGRRARRTEPPEQSPDVVIAGRGRHRREFEFDGKGGLKRCNGVADSLAPLEPLFRFEEDRVLGIEVLDRGHSALAVPLAEYLGQISQHEICQCVAHGIILRFRTDRMPVVEVTSPGIPRSRRQLAGL